jgi:hypothetical protein
MAAGGLLDMHEGVRRWRGKSQRILCRVRRELTVRREENPEKKKPTVRKKPKGAECV